MFNLRSLIWGLGESCTIVQSLNSEPENVLSSVPVGYGEIIHCVGGKQSGLILCEIGVRLVLR